MELKKYSIKNRVINGSKYSFQGFLALLNEPAFVYEVLLSCLLVPIALYLNVTIVEKILLITSCFFVMIVEALNSAIEKTVDRISYEKHSLSKDIKDMASFAVLLSIILFLIVWLTIIANYYL